MIETIKWKWLFPGLALLTPSLSTNLSAHKHENLQKKNVLFIAIDDMKPLLGCYGDPIAKKVCSPVEFVDIYPSLCELAGFSIPKKLDGISLVSCMKNPKKMSKKYAVSQYPRGDNKMGYSLRTEKYRYTVWVEWKNKVSNFDKIIAEELYDYEKDPLETVNQVNVKSYTTIANAMKKYMAEYIHSQK